MGRFLIYKKYKKEGIMRRGLLALFFATILLTGILATPAMAWDGAIGIVSVGYGDELANLVDDGFGLSLQAVNRSSNHFGIEFLMDLSFHDDALIGSNINCTRFDGGARLYLVSSPSLDVYGAAGLSYTTMNFTEYSDTVDGFSYYYGAGVEFPVSKYGAFDISARHHDWRATWDAGPPLGDVKLDATTTTIEAVYVFKDM